MNLTASPKDWIVSAASSGISMPNSSSKAITSSTVSRLSAPRSSMNEAVSVTLASSTLRCSTTIFLTRTAISLMISSSVLAGPLLGPIFNNLLPTLGGALGCRNGNSTAGECLRRVVVARYSTQLRFGKCFRKLTKLPASHDFPYRVFQTHFQWSDYKLKTILLAVLAVFLALVSIDSPQGLIYPMAILLIAARQPIEKSISDFPVWVSFLGLGTAIGLATEVFAILDNWVLPADQKVLLHPNPVYDLLFGLWYYLLFMVTWYVLLRRISFTKTAVFIGSGLFGALVENGGVHLLNAVANPLLGSIMLLIIMSVYGVFPSLAYLLTETRFEKRSKPRWWHYLLIAPAFFLFWAIYGNIVRPALLEVFPKGF